MPRRGAVIAADAQRYKGKGYVYGGSAASPGDWDCSSFVSYVLGHDLRLALPGGKWGGAGMPPGSHGPVVTDYASWQGATTVSGPSAGVLCCWVGSGANGHIGIAVSSSEMVSALNPSQGTVQTPIQGYGPAGAPLIYRRVDGTGGVVPPEVKAPGSGSVTNLAAGLLAGVVVVAAAAAAGVVIFVALPVVLGLIGTAAGAAAVAGARRAASR